MRRQRLAVSVPVPGSGVAEAVARLRAAQERVRRRRRRTGALRIRARTDGHVRVWRLPGEFLPPPRLRGRLVADAAGRVQLTGELAEHGGVFVWVVGYALCTLVPLLLLVGAMGSGSLSGMLVASVAVLVLGGLTWAFQRARRSFGSDAAELCSLLRRELGR